MKLFQKLLVASTAMSLITPLAAQASDTVNLDKVNNFSEVQRFDNKTFTNEVSDDLTVLKDILNRLSDKGLIGSDDLANLKESLNFFLYLKTYIQLFLVQTAVKHQILFVYLKDRMYKHLIVLIHIQ